MTKLANNKTILVIDDEKDLVSIIRNYLSTRGHHVIGRSNSSDVVKIVNEIGFDLAIIDQNMPDKKGDILADEILNVSPNTRIIIITATPSMMLMRFDGFIEKPIVFSELDEKIRMALE